MKARTWLRRAVAMLRRHGMPWLAAIAALHAAAATATTTTTAIDCPPQPRLPAPAELDALAASAPDRGLLWRLQRDGRVSYLYGTMHVGRLEWLAPGPTLRAALAASEVLALEVDPGDVATQAALADAAAPPGPPPTPTQVRRLARQARLACVEPSPAAAAPLLQAMGLSMLAARRDGLDPAYGQEIALATAWRASAPPARAIVALESVALQRRALQADAKDSARMLDQVLGQLESQQARRLLRQLAQAWEAGDLDALEHYERWCECRPSAAERALLRRLNDERNHALAAGIDALHGEGRGVFAAVGALHMTGPAALPRLLAARGFQVERVRFARDAATKPYPRR